MFTSKLLLAYLLQAFSMAGVDTGNIDLEEAYCLAKNVYFESKGEDIQGQFAVASVTLNRVRDSRFPDTICEVVKQTTVSNVGRRIVCQFSWYCQNRNREIPLRNRDGSINQRVVDKFQVASMVALITMSDLAPDFSRGATHFHNPNIVIPSWARTLRKTRRIGNHDFYALPPVRR